MGNFNARESLLCAREGWRARGQANVASDFEDGERRRLALYAERSFRIPNLLI
jgi:hypothetical protein